MHKTRMLVFAIGILMMLIFLNGRLMQIQLVQTENFSKHHKNLLSESVKQRTQEVIIEDGRGDFLDAGEEPLSYRDKTVLVLFPFLNDLDWDNAALANIIHVSPLEIKRKLKDAKEPLIFGDINEKQAEEISALNIPGVFAIRKKFPPDQMLASQLIGILGENSEEFKKRYPEKKGMDSLKIGITGLQQQFDTFLLPDMPSKLIFHVDGIGRPLFGIDVKYTGQSNPYYPLKIKTTIDKQIQEELESIVDESHIVKGGVILLDIESNSILANVSRPSFQPNAPFSNEGTKNMMFEEHIPGSVFKTVVAAAAIQEGLVDNEELFNCSINIRGLPDPRELGQLNIVESFSRSCNNTFATLANRLQQKDETLLDGYATRLGLIGPINWHGDIFQMEDFKQFRHSEGRIFTTGGNKKDPNLVAQTGIGQHEVRVSPLSVANMMATIARGGSKVSVRAASEIQYGNGTTMYSFQKQSMNENISTYTAMRMQELLRKVVTDDQGTGSVFANSPYAVAGKSGTAETGIQMDGNELYHKWFAGYFPFEAPKYALVVVNLEVPSSEGGVTGLFSEIVNLIYDNNHTRLETFGDSSQ